MEGMNSLQWQAKRAALRDKYQNRCAYCNAHTGKNGTADHYVPRAMGGGNALSNLRWSCETCNTAKADMSPAEWEQRAPMPQAAPETKADKRRAAFEKIYGRLRQPNAKAEPATTARRKDDDQ